MKALPRMRVMDEVIKREGYTKGVEIGVHQGRLFFYLLKHNPSLHLTGVDAWCAQPDKEGVEDGQVYKHWGGQRGDAHFEKMQGQLEGRNGTFIRKFSELAARDFDDGSVEFVFIDASHTTESVIKDIRAWAPKVTHRMYGHDIHWPSVEAGVRECFGKKWRYEHERIWSADPRDLIEEG